MSPRQAADRLFNRVMAASENGDSAEALRFAPMALQAYNNLGTLDNDARYHVALLHLTTDDTKGARVQVDLLRKSVPRHLLGFMLEHEIAERSGKQDSAARAFKAFLAAYDAEIATGREEYQDHLNTIERFRKAAHAGVAGKK
jgi:predicted Zn-dependent protease